MSAQVVVNTQDLCLWPLPEKWTEASLRALSLPLADGVQTSGSAGTENLFLSLLLQGTMFPALRDLCHGMPPRLVFSIPLVRRYLSWENEQRCRRLLEASTSRSRREPVSAAVLVSLCSVAGVPAVLYTLRSSTMSGKHKGDVRYWVAPPSFLMHLELFSSEALCSLMGVSLSEAIRKPSVTMHSPPHASSQGSPKRCLTSPH